MQLTFKNENQVAGELFIDGNKAVLPPRMPRTLTGYFDFLEKMFKTRYPARFAKGANVTIANNRASQTKALKNVQASPVDKSKWQPGADEG